MGGLGDMFGKFSERAKSGARALARARKGNVAMIFALSVIPVIIAGGAGIDLARALAVRSKLYSAVDAAALAVATKTGATLAQQQVLAQQYFNANYALNSSFGTPQSVSVTVNGQTVTVSTEIAMPTTLMAVAGIGNVKLKASSQVVWGQTKLWVALALDNTGSMCEPSSQPCPNPGVNTKMYALKAATKELLTILKNASATAGDVRVSMIPFAQTVNVGVGKMNETWIGWEEWSDDHDTWGTCSISGKSDKAACESASTGGGGSCSLSQYTTKKKCKNNGGTWTVASGTPGVWTPDKTKWTGCIMDRGDTGGPSASDYDVKNTAPAAAEASKFPATNDNCIDSTMHGDLGYDWAALNTTVDNMEASGWTNQPIGLAWAWHSLTGGDPLNAPSLPANTTRYIIILSDGLNTRNRWDTTQSPIDARMDKVCANAKADNIIIYAVFLDPGSALGSSTVMENCATGGKNGGNYFHLTNSNQVSTAFNLIGQKITNVRVSK